jgi:hypothetical protein
VCETIMLIIALAKCLMRSNQNVERAALESDSFCDGIIPNSFQRPFIMSAKRLTGSLTKIQEAIEDQSVKTCFLVKCWIFWSSDKS